MDDLARLLGSTDVDAICIGQNWDLEENVGDLRRQQFEICAPAATALADVSTQHFLKHVQGARRGHVSTTFDATLNAAALLPASLEDNQKVVRLERIDQLLKSDDGLTFERLDAALSPRDHDLLSTFTDAFQQFSGERPAFAAFKAEVETDLKQADWLDRLLARLGLAHLMPRTLAETFHFALMEYTIGEVRKQALTRSVDRPFALATVLESRCSPAFFPVPSGQQFGFAVDLSGPGLGTCGPQEFLHARFDYAAKHVLKLAKLQGPLASPNLKACRERHVNHLRRKSGMPKYGERHWPVTPP